MKYTRFALFLYSILFIILMVDITLAQTTNCPITIQSKTTTALLTELPSINTDLGTCLTNIPPQVKKLINNGILLLDITDKEDIAITIQNGLITGVAKVEGGSYNYKVTLSSCQLDSVLSSTNTIGAFAAYYLNGQAKITAGGFFGKIKLFITKIVGKGVLNKIKVPVTDCSALALSKKPTNCYETYMQGHEQYQYAKANWDAWLAETGHICQTQTAEAPKGGDCKHIFEQIKNNDKKWLCWY